MPEAQTNTDILHWSRLRKGDASSLEWIYNRYFKLLYNYGMKITTHRSVVEDAIHDLFVDLWRFRSNLSPTTSIRFYLYRSLRRRIVYNDRDQFALSLEVTHDKYLQLTSSLLDDMVEHETRAQQEDRLKRLLHDLSPRQYEALILRFYDELSFDEIAAILDVNSQSARNLVQRGLAQLKQFSRLLLPVILLTLRP